MDIVSVLAEKGMVDPGAVAAIKEEIASGKSEEQALLDRGVSREEVLSAQGEYYQIPTRVISDPISYTTLEYIPEESAKHYHFAPIGIVDGVLEVGTTDPDNLEAIEALNFIVSKTGLPYKLFLISESDFEEILKMYKGLTSEVGRALGELETTFKEDKKAPASKDKTENISGGSSDLKSIKEDAPVTKIVATIVRYAVDGNASDIHIEPTREELRVRFRVDGVLHTSLRLPASVERSVAARIKVLSNLKLDERRKPQDGRFSATIDEKRVDFRVSTFPTSHGEKIVMRILDKDQKQLTMKDLGLSEHNIEIINRAIKRPYGIIIISGPTGSGKSTTLYAMLQEIARDEKNVVSLEDPVEYDIAGVSQSQVRPEIGYTFATGLRSILRQDPDIIMVGEIRDAETAQLAIQAALTGHLVLTTLHTNNAIGIVPRLIDMGIDPYLIAPTLVLSVAQRLVRKRCESAGKKTPVQGAIQAMVENEFKGLSPQHMKRVPQAKEVYAIEPSPDCPNGTRGRLGVFELLPTSKELERAILADPTEANIMKIARQQGMFTMKEDAIIKMLEGTIPLEEVNTLGGDLVLEQKEDIV